MKHNNILFVILLMFCQNALSSNLMENYKEILNIIHGKPLELVGTPILCGDAPPSAHEFAADIKWLEDGEGSCKRVYNPKVAGLFTPLSHGGEISQFFFDASVYGHLLSTLDTILKADDLSNLALEDKLDFQMTFWELISVLEWRRDLKVSWQPDVDQNKMDKLLSVCNKILSKLLISSQELSKLEREADKTLLDLKSEIKNGCLKEVDFPSRIHEGMSQARLYGRVFLGTNKKEACNEFIKLISRGNREELALMPQKIEGFESYLVLYYNVLDSQYNVTTTNIIHGVRRINYLNLVNYTDNLLNKLSSFSVLTVEREKGFGAAKLEKSYKIIPENEVVRLGMPDVSPIYAVKGGAKVTTNKASCYSCHSSNVKSVDYRSVGVPLTVTFSNPFEKDGVFHRNNPLYEKIREKFLSWRDKYGSL